MAIGGCSAANRLSILQAGLIAHLALIGIVVSAVIGAVGALIGQAQHPLAETL